MARCLVVVLFASALGALAGCRGIGSSTPCAAGLEPFPDDAVVRNPRCPDACDPAAARAVVYASDGRPAYVGQAILINSCAPGPCHASGATGSIRFGAPAGLDFDLGALTDPSEEALASAMARRRDLLVERRGDVWGSITSGTMPPGALGRDLEIADYTWEGMGGPVTLARLESAEGREHLRNWLACGAPYVERTFDCPSGGCTGDVVPPLAVP